MLATMQAEDAMAAGVWERSKANAPLAPAEEDQKQLNLQKTRLESKFQELEVQRVGQIAKCQAGHDKQMERVEAILGMEDNSSKETLEKARLDLENYLFGAIGYLNKTIVGRVKDAQTLLTNASTKVQYEEVKRRLGEISKSLAQEEVKKHLDYVRSLGLTLANLGRKTRVQTSRDAARRAPVANSPLFEAMLQLGAEPHNCTESIFEAKGGSRACCFTISSDMSFQKIVATPMVKKSFVKISTALRRDGMSCAIDALVGGRQVMKRFDELVQLTFGRDLRSRRSLPQAEWANKVFEFRAFGSGDAASEVCWGNFGLMEAYVVLEGDMNIAGMRTEQVPGISYRAKREYLASLHNVADINNAVQQGDGFSVKFKDGVDAKGRCAVLIPSGFMMIVTSANARVLRWSLCADESDLNRTRATLRHLLEDFPETRDKDVGYVQFAQCLGMKV